MSTNPKDTTIAGKYLYIIYLFVYKSILNWFICVLRYNFLSNDDMYCCTVDILGRKAVFIFKWS